ncbi:hypothetical protein HZB78_05750 [Candidatus Collierbacteria bacterium]|nr:hypothetical protein [Candidatus Collierbacteria bacterium]
MVIRYLLFVIGAGLLLSGCLNKTRPENLGKETAAGEGVEIEDKIGKLQKQFGVIPPENVERAILNPVDGSSSSGLAIRDKAGTVTVMANLPDIVGKQKYTVRLVEDSRILVLGGLISNKGGWMLEVSTKMGENYKTAEVLLDDLTVLRGEFK